MLVDLVLLGGIEVEVFFLMKVHYGAFQTRTGQTARKKLFIIEQEDK